jgi:hypothetical protein
MPRLRISIYGEIRNSEERGSEGLAAGLAEAAGATVDPDGPDWIDLRCGFSAIPPLLDSARPVP